MAHYLNPAAYPPLLHAAEVLARAGWQVHLVGTHDGANGTMETGLDSVDGVRVTLLPAPTGRASRRALFVRFNARVFALAARSRPSWLYASDPLAAPVALAARRLLGTRVLYHEHDAPDDHPADLVGRAVAPFRRRLARAADLVVIPQAERLRAFVASHRRMRPTHLVWNVPLRRQARPIPRPASQTTPGSAFVLYYHGSLNAERVPPALVGAMARLPEHVRLRVVGYETVGSRGFRARVMAHANALGVDGRVLFGAPVSREALWPECDAASAGLVLMPLNDASDTNLSSMVGASNKAFDYLARGLPLVVSDTPAWRDAYVTPGYGVAVDPGSPESIAAQVRALLDAPADAQRMGEAGRQRVLADWNYETQFAPVLHALAA